MITPSAHTSSGALERPRPPARSSLTSSGAAKQMGSLGGVGSPNGVTESRLARRHCVPSCTYSRNDSGCRPQCASSRLCSASTVRVSASIVALSSIGGSSPRPA
eukprot:1260380-Prymnesium_polylepis.1